MLHIIMNYWIEILLTAITSLIIYVFRQYAGLRNGLEALLKNEIVRIYETYSKLGYCPSYMKENANEIYVNYNKYIQTTKKALIRKIQPRQTN